ncbi:MAG: potassium transporter TrkG [Candidatus Thermoplasmatota archaeon]
MKQLLANLGFLNQMAGIFIILPILVSFIYNELTSTIALFIAAITFLSLGFLLNALCERKELSFQESSSLIVLAFVFLSLIGSIPYMYVNISSGTIAQNITDSIFESASGFTTTGFSIISDLSALPKSLIFYRALTQFIGGIGIVLILLAFFYPDAKLHDFARSLGFTKNQKIKKTFLVILIFYISYCLVMIGLGVIFGVHDLITLISFIFSALSTGGFAPLNDITEVITNSPLYGILIVSMFLGAANFLVVAGLFKKQVKKFFKSEVSFYLLLIISCIIITSLFFKLSLSDSAFHIMSVMTTTGFSYLSISNFSESFKLFLVVLMFIGGTSLSTAGGIKIFRIVLFFKVLRKTVAESITKKDTTLMVFGKEYSNKDIIQSLVIILLMGVTVVCSAILVSGYGFSVVDSLFETTSAVATTGLSVGIVGPTLASELKWLFIVLMILGRVEIFSFLIMLSRKKTQLHTNEAK